MVSLPLVQSAVPPPVHRGRPLIAVAEQPEPGPAPGREPLYDVRGDAGRVTLYFPGPDAYVKHLHVSTAFPERDS
jgi:hypothetical protein